MAIRIPIVLIGGTLRELPSGDTTAAPAATISNTIAVPTTIAVDTSYPVVSYLQVQSVLTINGNVLVAG